jgi:transcriptional regulator with XRE-family HTH domain
MKKTKLLERRKAKGLSQNAIAEKLCVYVSNYNRRENGQVKISLKEWEKIANLLDVPIEDIYESDDTPVFTHKDSLAAHHQDINNIYPVPKHLLEVQWKYIEHLEKTNKNLQQKIRKLTQELERLKITTS